MLPSSLHERITQKVLSSVNSENPQQPPKPAPRLPVPLPKLPRFTHPLVSTLPLPPDRMTVLNRLIALGYGDTAQEDIPQSAWDWAVTPAVVYQPAGPPVSRKVRIKASQISQTSRSLLGAIACRKTLIHARVRVSPDGRSILLHLRQTTERG